MESIVNGAETSADGTAIAWTRQGEGPAVVMVAGVMASRARPQQPGLAEALAARATVFTYDRRGTGDSGDSSDYDVRLEPPLVPDPDTGPLEEARRRLKTDRADARRWFDEEVTGIPAEVRAQFPPLTQGHLDDAPAMLHELAFLPGTSADRFRAVEAPTLVLASDHTSPFLLEGVHALAAALPHATEGILPGQWHGLPVDTVVSAITTFLPAQNGAA
jgi:pimeloyl-ACP methyl ester carboxylesterase